MYASLNGALQAWMAPCTGLFSFVQGWNKPGFIPGFFRPGRNTFVQKLVDKTGNNLKHDGIVILPALK